MGEEYTHLDEVTIRDSQETRALRIAGAVGVVLGISESSQDRWYSVMVDSYDESFFLAGTDLRATGRRRSAEEFYDGSSIRVSQRGHLLQNDGAEE